MPSSVEKRTALILPVLILDKLAGAILICSAKSLSDIFLSAMTRSSLNTIGIMAIKYHQRFLATSRHI